MIKVNRSEKEYGMVNFGRCLQKSNPDQSLKLENNLKVTGGSHIATAEYSYFYIHQIKAWPVWSTDQTEISYTVMPSVL